MKPVKNNDRFMARTFRKMHGLGNDFVVVDARSEPFTPGRDQVQTIADRHYGVGCDQLIIMEPSSNANLFMRVLNADGTASAACGNATRCLADLLMREGVESPRIETSVGVLPAWRDERGTIWVDMGMAMLEPQAVPIVGVEDTSCVQGLALPGLGAPVVHSMGNPHCVYITDDIDALLIEDWAPAIETHNMFPEKTNVHLIQVLDRKSIRQRVWERGVGLTLASGSGACAGAVAAIRRGLTERKVDVELDGGHLHIHWRDDGHVIMGGAVGHVFTGILDESLSS